MPSEPQIDILPYSKRQRFFFVLCALFAILLPTMIFYTTGYRIDLDDAENRIVTTGGLYITTDNLDVDVYLDDEQIRKPRLFRSAYYIQDVEAGMHRVVVQQDGLHTWVKELPVDPYLVVEAAAFNMPLQPQLRHVPQYFSDQNEVIVQATASTSTFFTYATTTSPVLFATTTATSTYVQNSEYDFIRNQFSTSTATSTSLFDRFMAEVERFGFATTSENVSTSTPVEFPRRSDIMLVPRNGELYAVWQGEENSIPYYFCVSNVASSSILDRYGEHVVAQIEEQQLSTTTPLFEHTNRLCRSEIRIDRKRQHIQFFDFLPSSSDLVLLQLEDGLYVSEIDDRAWQNTQQIFPGNNFSVMVVNNSIYLKQGELYAELLTELPER